MKRATAVPFAASIATPLVFFLGRYVLHWLTWEIENLFLAVLVGVVLILTVLFLSWYLFGVVFKRQTIRTKKRRKIQRPKHSARARVAAVFGILLSGFLLFGIVLNFFSFLHFRSEAEGLEEHHLLLSGTAQDTKQSKNQRFQIFVQQFEGQGTRRSEINFANRVYEKVLYELENTTLPASISKGKRPTQREIDALIDQGRSVFFITGWYDAYAASITITQYSRTTGRQVLHAPPDQARDVTHILGHSLAGPREWQYYVRVGAAKEITCVVMHLIGTLSLGDDDALFYSEDYKEHFDRVFTALRIANKNIPMKLTWFGLRPRPDARLRPHILYNDIGRAHYARASRALGPYLGDELKESNENWDEFIHKQTVLRVEHLRRAQEWFKKAYSTDRTFAMARANDLLIDFLLNAYQGKFDEVPDFVAEIEELLANYELRDEERTSLRSLVEFFSAVIKASKPSSY